MKVPLMTALALLMLVSFPSPLASQIYRWRDKDGNLVISTTPPPPGVKWEKKKTEGDRQSVARKPADPTKPDSHEVELKRPLRDIKVIMYMADWCPTCRKASQFFKSLGVNLVELDVEKDANGEQEWSRKAGKNRVVPILDIEGTVLVGLDPEKIRSVIESKRISYNY